MLRSLQTARMACSEARWAADRARQRQQPRCDSYQEGVLLAKPPHTTLGVSHVGLPVSGRRSWLGLGQSFYHQVLHSLSRSHHLEQGPLLHAFQDGPHALPVLLLQPSRPAPPCWLLTLWPCTQLPFQPQASVSEVAGLSALEAVVSLGQRCVQKWPCPAMGMASMRRLGWRPHHEVSHQLCDEYML